MSRATKRKYVTKEVLEDFVELSDDQDIVKVCWCGFTDSQIILTPSTIGSWWAWKQSS